MEPATATIEMQPWLTLTGSLIAMAQPRTDWIDAGPYADAIFVVDVAELLNAELQIQTSPTPDEDYFLTMTSSTVTSVGKKFITVKQSASVPLIRYVRWYIQPTSFSWNATFRMLAVFKRTP